MTITYVGVGDPAAVADNAAVTPILPPGVQAGDVLVLFAAIRNTTASIASVMNPGGWTRLDDGSVTHLGVYGKVYDGSGAPTVTPSGGSAGDTVSAQVAAFRGASLSVNGTPAWSTNASGQNIAYSAYTPARDNGVVLALGWKADDWSSVATISGMTELDESPTTTGNDQGIVWDYVIQTTATAITSGSFTVTGGTSAVSKGLVLGLDPAAEIAVIEQDVYPPRVQVAVTKLVPGQSVEVYRVVAGQRTLVRAGSDAAVTDTSFTPVDAELPFGVPVSYVAVVDGGTEYASASDSYYLPGQKVVLSDAISGLAAEVVITAWPDKPRARQSSTFVAGGRNIAVLGDLAGFSGTVDVYVETTSAVDNVNALLDNATNGTIQIRQAGGYDGIDCYVAVLGATEHRFSQDGSDQRRTFSLDVLQNDGWAPALEARGFTYADAEAAYDGLSYNDAEGDFATYLDAELADWSS